MKAKSNSAQILGYLRGCVWRRCHEEEEDGLPEQACSCSHGPCGKSKSLKLAPRPLLLLLIISQTQRGVVVVVVRERSLSECWRLSTAPTLHTEKRLSIISLLNANAESTVSIGIHELWIWIWFIWFLDSLIACLVPYMLTG